MSVVIAIAPIAVATVRAIHRRWLPIGDNAYFSLRAGDVLTRHNPLLGTWTSASVTAGINFNNPGPLLFDVLAVPQRIAPGGAGLAVGVAILNSAAIVGIGVFAYRRGGALLTTLAMLATASVAWSMGSELLYDPWQPHSLVLPFLCFLVLVWSSSCGDLIAVPCALAVGSLILQTHLTFGILVPGLMAWALASLALDLHRHRTGREGAHGRSRLITAALLSGAVLAVCWAQPIFEQFTGDGKGNISRVIQVTGSSKVPAAGFGLGSRLVASIVTMPPWWLRPSFSNAFLGLYEVDPAKAPRSPTAGLPSTAVGVGTLSVLVAALVFAAWAAHRRSDRASSRAATTAVLALILGLVTASKVPIKPFGIAAHQFRWLWPIAAFVVLALATTVARSLADGRVTDGKVAASFAAATLVVSGLTLPVSNGRAGPQVDAWSIPVIRDLNAQMKASKELHDAGRVLANDYPINFAEPFGAAIMAELQRLDIEFVLADEGPVRQVGPSRRFTGHNARARISYLSGSATLTTPSGARRIAFHPGISDRERQELTGLQRLLGPALRDGDLRFNAKGRDAVRANRLPTLAARGPLNPDAVYGSRNLVTAVRGQMLDLQGTLGRRAERYADLQFRADRDTVAVVLAPIDPR